jgi:hypothetical protein
VLVVGWSEGGKGTVREALPLQADPFHARRAGANPQALANVQREWLLQSGKSRTDEFTGYARSMRLRRESATDGANDWCDGAAALVLRRAHEGTLTPIVDFASTWRPFTPTNAEDMDPAGWVEATLALLPRSPQWKRELREQLVSIEASAPTTHCERRALEPLLGHSGWNISDDRINRHGGGAAQWFGPASGLRALAHAQSALRDAARGDVARGDAAQGDAAGTAVVLDLCGPIGQAATAVVLRQGAAQ